jgi:hypothetical protein
MDILKSITKMAIPAVIRQAIHGRELDMGERREIINLYIKMFMHLNNGDNSSLINFANQLLSDDHTSEEIGKQISGFLIRNLVEYALSMIESEEIENTYVRCILEAVKEPLCSLFSYLPKLPNSVSCSAASYD